MRHIFPRTLLFAVAIALFLGGCGTPDEGVTVTGSVVKGGKPIDGVTVGFSPVDFKEGTAGAAAKTGADGKFELKVKPGKYVVVLTKMVDRKGNVPIESENPTEDLTQLEASGYLRNALPDRFSDPTLSPLGVEVPPGGTEFPPFDVAK